MKSHLASYLFGLILLICFQDGVVGLFHANGRGHHDPLAHDTEPWQADLSTVSLGSSTKHRSDASPAKSVGRRQRSLAGRLFSNDGTCPEHSEINENTIIRTKDSRALGAKFLNETSLGPNSRDQCLSLCCSFRGCNVAVYEEKDGGNCYLFDCGPAEDFRCKFTSHSHYTSAVIRDSSHEEELTQLKKIPGQATVIDSPATQRPPTTTAATAITVPTTTKPGRQCSRFQFECHTTGECIAIYNACDGIPQCADGSDEAPELGCPVLTTESTTTRAAPVVPTTPAIQNRSNAYANEASMAMKTNINGDWRSGRDRFPVPLNEAANNPQQRWHSDGYRNSGPNNGGRPNYDSSNVNGEPEVERSRYYNSENRHYGSWPEVNNDYRQSGGAGGPVVGPVGSDTYVDRYNYNQDKGRLLPYADGANYRSEGTNFRKHDWVPDAGYDVNNPSLAQIDSRKYNPSIVTSQNQRQPVADSNANRASDFSNQPARPAMNRPNYNQYDDVNARQPYLNQASPPPRRMPAAIPPAPGPAIAVIPAATTTTTMASTTVATSTPKVASLITKQTESVNHAHVHRFHVNQAEFQEEKAERTRQTVGAAWALTLGLSVTAVLVLLVGFRLRSLKRHLRGRGRNGFSRDADYLVNGMYL